MEHDLGLSYMRPIQIKIDASAAFGIGSRLGIGQVSHIKADQLCLQDSVHKGEIILRTVGTEENIADAPTKAVSCELLEYHVGARLSRMSPR